MASEQATWTKRGLPKGTPTKPKDRVNIEGMDLPAREFVCGVKRVIRREGEEIHTSLQKLFSTWGAGHAVDK